MKAIIDEQVLRDAARLRNGKLHEYLIALREEALELLADSNDNNEIRRLQGEIATLKALIEMIESAVSKLDKKGPKADMSKVF